MFDDEIKDTSPAMRKLQKDLIGSLTDSEKLLRVLAYMEFAKNCMLAGIKEQYPHSSEEDLLKRYAARTIGKNFTIKEFNWDPEIEGY